MLQDIGECLMKNALDVHSSRRVHSRPRDIRTDLPIERDPGGIKSLLQPVASSAQQDDEVVASRLQ